MSNDIEKNKRVTAVFKKYQAALKGFIASQTPTKEDSEDILQDVFLRWITADTEESPIQQVSAWLYTVARHLIIDRRRKRCEERLPEHRYTDETEDIPDKYIEYPADDSSSPEINYLRSLIASELDAALRELPDEQRAVFELMELEGFSAKEISESTGVPINTLLSRKHYAVQRLRKQMKSLYKEL